MDLFQPTLILATLLCSLVAGFVFAFAVVVMPGSATLDDAEFLRSFQAIDRVIQNNQPLFILVWLGSVVALLAAAGLGFGRLAGPERLLLSAAVVIYLFGVQVPTVAINVPLNNQVQALKIEAMDAPSLASARHAFEPRWTRWNAIRTLLATVASAMLLVLLLRL